MKQLTAKVLSYIKKSYAAEPEYLWLSSPNSAALRHKESRKWFAVLLCDLNPGVFSLEGENVDVINFKCDPRIIGSLLDGRGVFPAYHMNKEHWISVLLDGSVSFESICALADMSYTIIDRNKKTASKG